MRTRCAAVLGFCLLAAVPLKAQFPDGHVFVTDYSLDAVYEVDPVDWSWSVVADSARGISRPSAVGLTYAGELIVACYGSREILEIDHLGNVQVVLDFDDDIWGPFGENGIAIDGQRRVYISDISRNEIQRWDHDYTNPTVFADIGDGIQRPEGMLFIPNGDLMVADRLSGGQVFRIDPTGNVSVFDVIPGEQVVSIDRRSNGDLYVSCYGGGLYRYVGGSVSQRVKLGTYGNNNAGIKFSADGSMIYHANFGDGKLRTIDPDTGVETVVVDAGWGGLIGIAVAGRQNPPGSFVPFGAGVGGAGGVVPDLEGRGEPRAGHIVTLEVRDFVGGAASLLIAGFGRRDQDFRGGTLYVSLAGWFSMWPMILPGTDGAPGEGDLDLDFTLPDDPALIELDVFFQQVALDPAAIAGASMTNGLWMLIGE